MDQICGGNKQQPNEVVNYMKSTKTLLIAALAAGALFAGGSSLLAQDATNTPPAGQHRPGWGGPMTIDRLAKQLKLTDAEKTQVAPIIEAQNKKLADLREDTSLSREDKMAKRKAIMDETTTQLKPILTDEQFAKWQKMTQHMHHASPGGDNAGTPPPSTPPQN
jgi:periplasmic protein CpxP/Spy